jgi:glycosyltransferase involved in cell wall biosynthesis
MERLKKASDPTQVGSAAGKFAAGLHQRIVGQDVVATHSKLDLRGEGLTPIDTQIETTGTNLKAAGDPERQIQARPIGVCIIDENCSVPPDRRVWQEARALAAAGYRVSVICPKSREFSSSRETLEGIEIYRHPTWQAGTPLGYVIEYSWALLWEFFLALRVYARTRFRILHACNPPDTIFLIGSFLKLFGVRFVFDHHDLSPELVETKFGARGLLYRLGCLLELLTFRTADVSIATNESYREVAMSRGGMSPDCVFTVRGALDLSMVRQRDPKFELKEGKRHLVVYLGTMNPQEGVDGFLESVASIVVHHHRRDTLFVLIGVGSEVPRLKVLASKKGLDSVVKFTGYISDEALELYLSTADAAVAPDPFSPLNDKSTMNKIMHYMAYGLPIVLFDLTEGRRSAGDAALYARPNDQKDFAAQIMKLLDSEALRKELGNHGRTRVERSLNWHVEKQMLLRAYSRALQS